LRRFLSRFSLGSSLFTTCLENSVPTLAVERRTSSVSSRCSIEAAEIIRAMPADDVAPPVIAALSRQSISVIEVDMAGVDVIGAPVIAALLHIDALARQRGKTLRLVRCSRRATQHASLCGLAAAPVDLPVTHAAQAGDRHDPRPPARFTAWRHGRTTLVPGNRWAVVIAAVVGYVALITVGES
jgi:ABC-type transporter Mla MlaB component